jgi:DNA-directed RNA polymerase subunit RPC12/RpoP
MDPWDDLINYELCFPGSVTGSTEVQCPHCGELLTVRVDDPMGCQSYECGECGGEFIVNWGDGNMTRI